MPSEYPFQIKVFALIVIVCALTSNILLLKEYAVVAPGILENNPLTVYEKRFEKLKEVLPPDSVVGYAAGKSSSKTRASMEYQHTQYALAPRIVVRNPNLQTVIVNTLDKRVVSELQAKGYTIEKDCGNGVVLMRKKDEQ